jgi:hypothetical protein
MEILSKSDKMDLELPCQSLHITIWDNFSALAVWRPWIAPCLKLDREAHKK